MKKKDILLADDDPRDVELTTAALMEHKISNKIVVARDGVEALDYLLCRGAYEDRNKGNPLLILLDLKMPKIDGLEVLKVVKENPNLKSIPVVMLTSSEEEKDVVKSYDLGGNAYVVKPVEFEDFVSVVKRIGLFWILTNHSPAD